MARFLELCLDTANPGSDIATFWAAVSGGRTTPATSGGPADVVGDHEQHGISICPVTEPKTVKNRVHLDIYARSVDDLTALGAVVELPAEESGFHWTVMRDPEGNEFCAFLREMSCRPTASTASSSTPPTPSPGRAVVGRRTRCAGDRQRRARRRLVHRARRHR